MTRTKNIRLFLDAMPTIRIAAAVTLVVLMGWHPLDAPAAEANLSCARPANRVERRICQSPYARLKDVHRDLTKWYRLALAASSNPATLRLDQGQWEQDLDRCIAEPVVESRPYVCDSASGALAKNQCNRDFCLVDRYHERSQVLHRLSTAGLPPKYLLSRRWPSGFRDTMSIMDEDDRPLCRAVESHLPHAASLTGPLVPNNQFRIPPPWPSFEWRPVEHEHLLSLAQRLEVLLRKKWGHALEPGTAASYTELLESRAQSGELEILVSPPHGPDGKARVLRYQRWTRGTKTTPYEKYGPVEFFLSQDSGLSQLTPLREGNDAFLFHGEVFIALTSERQFDDSWKHLPLSQPVLYLYKVIAQPPDSATAIAACYFLYSGPL